MNYSEKITLQMLLNKNSRSDEGNDKQPQLCQMRCNLTLAFFYLLKLFI